MFTISRPIDHNLTKNSQIITKYFITKKKKKKTNHNINRCKKVHHRTTFHINIALSAFLSGNKNHTATITHRLKKRKIILILALLW